MLDNLNGACALEGCAVSTLERLCFRWTTEVSSHSMVHMVGLVPTRLCSHPTSFLRWWSVSKDEWVRDHIWYERKCVPERILTVLCA